MVLLLRDGFETGVADGRRRLLFGHPRDRRHLAVAPGAEPPRAQAHAQRRDERDDQPDGAAGAGALAAFARSGLTTCRRGASSAVPVVAAVAVLGGGVAGCGDVGAVRRLAGRARRHPRHRSRCARNDAGQHGGGVGAGGEIVAVVVGAVVTVPVIGVVAVILRVVVPETLAVAVTGVGGGEGAGQRQRCRRDVVARLVHPVPAMGAEETGLRRAVEKLRSPHVLRIRRVEVVARAGGAVRGGIDGGGHAEGRQPQLVDDVVELGGELRGRREPVPGFAGAGVRHQVVELRGHAVDDLRRRRNVPVQPLQRDRQRGIAAERGGAREQLVEKDARGIHVGGRGDLCAGDLLGRQVTHRAHDDGIRRDLRIRRRAHQTEVGELDLAGIGDEHVFGLDVAVDHRPFVRQRQRAQHRPQHGRRRVGRHGAALAQQLPQGAAVDELHDQEDVPGRIGTLVVDVDQRLVGHAGHRPGLALEADAEGFVVDEPRVHHLRGDVAAQPQIRRAVDGAHAAARDERPDAVPAVEDVALAHFSHQPVLLPLPPTSMADRRAPVPTRAGGRPGRGMVAA